MVTKNQKEKKVSLEQADGVVSPKGLKELLFENINLKILANNVPFIVYLAFLAIIYITNNAKAADIVRETEKTKKEIKELKWEYLDVQSRLIYATSESQLTQRASVLGLLPLEKPAFEIRNTVIIEEKKGNK